MVTEFVSIELPGQLLVIKCDDSLGEGHRLVINRTNNLKSDWGDNTSNEESYKLRQEEKQAKTAAGGQ